MCCYLLNCNTFVPLLLFENCNRIVSFMCNDTEFIEGSYIDGACLGQSEILAIKYDVMLVYLG